MSAWAAYGCFQQADHQTCLAHLLRRCGEMLETATRGAVRFPRAVKGVLQAALALRDRRDAEELSRHVDQVVGQALIRLVGEVGRQQPIQPRIATPCSCS